MLTTSKYIVDLFAEISAAVATDTGMSVNYLYGHPVEIVDVLSDLAKDITGSVTRFPLIALFQDFTEDKKGVNTDVKLTIIIAQTTLPSYRAADRYTNTFKTVLYPVYESLLRQIAASRYFKQSTVTQIDHQKTDRLYWGKQGLYGNSGNVFNDHVDAIELELSLTVVPVGCLITNV